MNLIVVICMLWLGIGEAGDVVEELEAVTFEHIADPVDRWRPLVEKHFPADEVDTALCIIGHESAGDPMADNPTSSAVGLFQVLGSMWAPRYGVTTSQLYHPEINAWIAGDIWQRLGWGAWSPYQRGACR